MRARHIARWLSIIAIVASGSVAESPQILSRAAAVTPLSISVHGRYLVNDAGQRVQLHGVDASTTADWCMYTFNRPRSITYSDHDLADEARIIATWHANAVRVPLNEDCWLGINGEPAAPGATAAGYRRTIKSFASDLNAERMYVILDLHYNANGKAVSDDQRQLPDHHSASFWKSVASTFKSNHAVIFDAYNEPVAITKAFGGDHTYPVSWSCWRNGGCTVSNVAIDNKNYSSQTYRAVGLQAMVDAIRSVGARQPIMLGGLDWANDLSGWLAHEPHDPASPAQLIASFHVYDNDPCAGPSCWNRRVATVAGKVPVVGGEFGQYHCDVPGMDTTWMDWADAHDVSYLAWSFTYDDGLPKCGAPNFGPYLVKKDYKTPEATNGQQVYDHLIKFPAP